MNRGRSHGRVAARAAHGRDGRRRPLAQLDARAVPLCTGPGIATWPSHNPEGLGPARAADPLVELAFRLRGAMVGKGPDEGLELIHRHRSIKVDDPRVEVRAE